MDHDGTDMELVEHRMNIGEVREEDLMLLEVRDDCEAITLLA
jgi:hypothetical protein